MPDPEYDRDEWLRVKDKDLGYDYSIRGSQLPHGNYQVLKQDALDVGGEPLPPDFHLDDKAESATTKKEA